MSPQLSWYYRNKEKALADVKAWQKANPDRHKENINRWKRENRAKVAFHQRKQSWRRRGIELTHEEYKHLWDSQDGCCKICGKVEGKRKLAVDHDHNTGAVRGLLCAGCNIALGHVEAYLEAPKRWDDYLQAAESKAVESNPTD